MMITFLLYTLVAWAANACLAKILYISIQPGQWLDKLLNWQDRLHRWDLEGKEFLVKAGGLCELCFCHAISFCSFWLYLFFMHQVLGFWITDPIGSNLAGFLINIIWYLAYVGIGTHLALYFVTQLFKE